jgi:hypothetical protein
MVVLWKLDAETDEITAKFNENDQKGRCLLDFSAPINQDFEYFEQDFTYETNQLHSHSQRLLAKLSESPNF